MLNQLSANNVDGDRGTITYTQWLNEAGKLEADLTVTKLDDDRYWVVAPTPPTATSRLACAGTSTSATPSPPT
jgi:glycine cleavage system aminomethyltransferase T